MLKEKGHEVRRVLICGLSPSCDYNTAFRANARAAYLVSATTRNLFAWQKTDPDTPVALTSSGPVLPAHDSGSELEARHPLEHDGLDLGGACGGTTELRLQARDE